MIRKRLLIIGAGGFGREVLAWASDIPQEKREWDVGGFLDANPRALDGFDVGYEIFADPARYAPAEHEVFVCAVGDPRAKLLLARGIESRGGRFISLIHPTAIVGQRCRIGAGAVLCPYSVVTTDATLGDFVTLNVHASVGHDSTLGDGVTLNGHADVTGRAVLEEGVSLGSHAVVAPGVRISAYAKIGAGSVAFHKSRPGAVLLGVPAKSWPSAA
jgi:sugar O-acyltransferase (sialic acid O-acetyltransferase NeuD family)